MILDKIDFQYFLLILSIIMIEVTVYALAFNIGDLIVLGKIS